MKFKNLNTEARQILNTKCAKSCEAWAKNPVLHPTVDTYCEAFAKGAKAALSLPVMTFSEAAAFLNDIISYANGDHDHEERAWRAIQHGDATTVEDALLLTEKVDLSPDPDDDEQTPPAASQEAADPDKEDAQ